LINVDSHLKLVGHILDTVALDILKRLEGLAINLLYSNIQKHFAAVVITAESILLQVSLLKINRPKIIRILADMKKCLVFMEQPQMAFYHFLKQNCFG
jgi:hypothetical protein